MRAEADPAELRGSVQRPPHGGRVGAVPEGPTGWTPQRPGRPAGIGE